MRVKKDNEIVVLCVGDLIGEPGMAMLEKHLATLKKRYAADLVIANGENSAKLGRGITAEIMGRLRELGVSVVTSGNHVWDNAKIVPYFSGNSDLLRPANYPAGCPGTGVTLVPVGEHTVGVVNILGRVFMKEITDCPFRTMQSILTYVRAQTPLIVVDFHAEASAEKLAMANFLDGQVSALVGTHVHVQTADERIFPQGMAFISDLGMVGSWFSIIGVKKESPLNMFLTQMPHRFEVSYDGPFVFNAVAITLDALSGKATDIERIQLLDHDLALQKT